jgi:Uma2 family endonuclease
MSMQLLKRRFTVDEYHRMAEVGILSEDDRVELIDGEIVEMVPIGSRHAASVDRLTKVFTNLVGDQAIVRVQNLIRLGGHSEPQPDIALLRPRADFYASAHPGPEDVLLVVEVAETSADTDRAVKLLLYARAGVLEAWLVDLSGEIIEAYRHPSPDGYRSVQHVTRGQTLSAQTFPDLSLPVDGIL